jgi:hypothetical protein
MFALQVSDSGKSPVRRPDKIQTYKDSKSYALIQIIGSRNVRFANKGSGCKVGIPPQRRPPMASLAFIHDDCLRHLTPPGHPERVERLAAVGRGLSGLAVERRDCPMGDEADVLRCHPASYLQRVKSSVPNEGWAQLDPDTFLSPGSYQAAMRAVGGICAAVDAVVTGGARTAFVAGRPPGHHA